MLLGLLKQRILYFHGNNHGNPGNINPENLISISNMPFFKLYQEGINFLINSQYQKSNEAFKKSLKVIEEIRQDFLPHYISVMKKIASNNIKMNRYKAVQDNIYDIIKHKKKHKVNSAIIYEDYNILFRHLLQHDLQRAVILGKALLSEREIKQIPVYLVKQFELNLGNAYLLQGNYADAKKRFWRCLQSDPNGTTKIYALNNLALACWWHKNPIFKNIKQSFYHSQEKANIDKQFQQVLQLLKQSLLLAQKVPQMPFSEVRIRFQETINQGILHQNLQFTSRQSFFPIKNISEFLIHNDPTQRIQILFWCNQFFKISQNLSIIKQLDRSLITINLLSNNPNLENDLQKMVHKYNGQFQAVYYHKLLANIYKRKNQNQKFQNHLAKANQIESSHVPWKNRFSYLAISDFVI